ncbi:MAG: OstA family protein [Chitinophagaceae bacterium]|nr:OstA family protein [Chitinophagaceae bacterium]
MLPRILLLFFLLAGFFINPLSLHAQVVKEPVKPLPPPATTAPVDSTTLIEILPGVRKLEFRKVNDSTQLQILAGNVKLKQGNSLFYCDSCVINNNTHTFEAWGKVHITDADTADITASHLLYYINRRVAYLDGGVRLSDGKGSLTTPDLEYDMATNLGIYHHGGKVLNKKTVLTSDEGYYYADLKDVYFKQHVELKDPAYYIKTDSLLYNTESQTTRFIARTYIRDSSGRTIETSDGFYNMATGHAEFGNRPIIRDKNLYATGNQMISNDSAGIVQFRGNAVVIDSSNHTTLMAGNIFINKKTNSMLATNKPLMIVVQDDDSIYISADTLFSARLTDLYAKRDSAAKDTIKGKKAAGTGKDSVAIDSVKGKKPLTPVKDSVSVAIDTIKGKKVMSLDKISKEDDGKDSTNRYFEAFRNVKIFSDSLQAVSDSMFYSFKDSVFRLYQNPFIWSKGSQISGDTVLLYTKNKKADRVKVFDNSLLVNKLDPEVFNQVQSTRMDGYFKDGSIDSVRAAGFAQCIYFIQDDDSAYTGINESASDMLDIYFAEQQLQKVVFRSAVTGTIWPIRQKDPRTMRLPRFIWMEDMRPKSKYELMGLE